MKKTLLLATVAGLAFAGCVENEPVTKGDGAPERITFDQPVVSVPTRATEIYGNYPKDKDFGVYALYHEGAYNVTGNYPDGSTDASWKTTTPIYMSNVKCVANKTGSSDTPDYWQPEVTYYWPKNKGSYLTFAAYAPHKASGVDWTVKGFQFSNFEVNATSPADQIDLLYSERVYDKQSTDMLNESNKAPYQGITIPFKHALSSILFKAKTTGLDESVSDDSKKTVITLTGITVKNVINKGSFNQNLTAPKTGDSNTPEWTLSTDASDVKEYTVFSGSLVLTNSEAYVNGAVDGADEKYDTTEGDQVQDVANGSTNSSSETINNNGVRRSDLIVIPQALKRTNADNSTTNISVTITYTIKTGNGYALEQVANYYVAVPDTNNNGTQTTDGSWEMGKRYTYHITIGLNKIYFNPQVTNWTDVEGDLVTASN